MTTPIFFSFLLFFACSPDTKTDPNLDSDGDGFSDVEETEAGTNPESSYSYPLAQGNYNIGQCTNGINSAENPSTPGYFAEGGGIEWMHYSVGDIVENMVLSDQYGQEVSLYQFCGQHIMLVTASFT